MDVDVLGAAAGQDVHGPALMALVAHPHPEQEPAMIELMLEMRGAITVEEARRPAAEQAAPAAGDRGGSDHRGDGAARGHDRAGRNHRADIRQTADDAGPADRQRMIADEGGARHRGVVLELLHLSVGVTELLLDRLLARQQAELGPVEARAQQVLDRVLEGIAVVEHTNRLADHVDLFGSVHRRSPIGYGLPSARCHGSPAQPATVWQGVAFCGSHHGAGAPT